MQHLPGLYWDPSRNRYFSQQPPPQPNNADNLLEPYQSRPKHRTTFFNLYNAFQTAPFQTSRDRSLHTLLSTTIASTSRMNHNPTAVFGRITAFCSTSLNGNTRRYLGDDRGWLYTCSTYQESDMQMWPPELNLHPHSQVSSISISGHKCVATCFGPVAKIAIQDLDVVGQTTLLTLNGVHDVWSGHLQGNALTLGAHKQAIHIPDIEGRSSLTSTPRVLHTASDVFSISQHPGSIPYSNSLSSSSSRFPSESNLGYSESGTCLSSTSSSDSDSDWAPNLIYTGLRNGSVVRFDLRMDVSDKGQKKKVFETRFAGPTASASREGLGSTGYKQRSPVVFLKVMRDWQVLVGNMNGQLSSYDLRFPDHSTPTRIFKGHVNNFTQPLGICTDPHENFLFAAGEDCRIRGWSLRTGEPLYHSKSSPSPSSSSSTRSLSNDGSLHSQLTTHDLQNPFTSVFPNGTPVSAMQVTEETDGLSLWAAAGQDLYEYQLGQVDGLRTF